MKNATNAEGAVRVALVLRGAVARRLAPGLARLVGPRWECVVLAPESGSAELLERLLKMRPAGIIMEFDGELTEQVASLGFPVVVVLADLLLEGMGGVAVDDLAVGRMAADYLWDKGLRRFGFCGLERFQAPERRTGFCDRLRERGASVFVYEEPEGRRRPRGRDRIDALAAWVGSLPLPAGVFAAHDPLGQELMEACRQRGIRVPLDLAVLSASDEPYACELCYPGLSSVEIPWEQVGLEAGLMVQAMALGERSGAQVWVKPTGIHTRGSTDFFLAADERVQRAVAVMRDNLGDFAGVGELARAVGMDRRALERLFRSQLNRSPKEVLIEMRLGRARELLEQSALRVVEVAAQCGFGDSSALSSAFRKRFGKTPRAWRHAR